ncbi:MAG: extracellular solute-binding protein [Candidatus Merdivicinus sp.]
MKANGKWKISAGILAAVLLLSACGQSGGSSTGESTPASSTPADNSAAESSTPDDVVSEYGDTGGLTLPLVDKEVKLTWSLGTVADNINDLLIPKEICKRTGIDLEIQAYPYGSYGEKVKVIMGSGNLPDIVSSPGSMSEINVYGGQGAFAPINQYLDYLPNFKSIYVDDEENNWYLYSYSNDNGDVFLWPVYGLNRDVNHGWLYRADIFEKNGIEPWTDTESFYQALKKLKEAYPDSYPLASKNQAGWFNAIAKYWGASGDRYYDEADGTWKYGATSDGYKEMLDFLKKCYNEGLLDPEFLTDTQDSWSAKMTTDKAFVTYDWIGRLDLFTNQMKDANPDYDLRYGYPIGSTGKQFSLDKISVYGVCVSAASKNVIPALQLLDYLCSPSGSELFTIGIEGVNFEWDENGKPVYPELADEELIDIKLLETKYGMWAEPMYLRPDHRSVYYNFSEREQEAQDICNNITGYNPLDPMLKLTDAETEIYNNFYLSVDTALKEFSAKYVTDASYGDAQWEEWKTKVAGLGEADALKALNDAQARYDAEKK